jgi:outer membrane protein assembly factor BamD
MKAFSNYRLSPSYRLDQTFSQKAIEEFQLFVNTYPTSDRVEECNRLIDVLRAKLQKKAYAEGELYFNLRNYESAVRSFENLLRDFPETADSEKVRYMVIRSLFLYANNSVVTKQPERFSSVTKKMGDFKKKYPSTRFRKELAEITNTTNSKIKELRNEGYKI